MSVESHLRGMGGQESVVGTIEPGGGPAEHRPIAHVAQRVGVARVGVGRLGVPVGRRNSPRERELRAVSAGNAGKRVALDGFESMWVVDGLRLGDMEFPSAVTKSSRRASTRPWRAVFELKPWSRLARRPTSDLVGAAHRVRSLAAATRVARKLLLTAARAVLYLNRSSTFAARGLFSALRSSR